jgi:hypothetical protein
MKFLSKFALAGLIIFSAAPALAQYDYPAPPPRGYPTPGYVTRSDFYRDHPHEDPEPFRCTYANDITCPAGQATQSSTGDPRDDPEPFRCTYSAGPECGGYNSGLP